AQLVERNLAKVEVASSSLVSRSRFKKNAPARGRFSFVMTLAARGATFAPWHCHGGPDIGGLAGRFQR
ncbi:hypothetical protein, partial [Stenotrophomonas maltophilia]|uniref:hypothetical protein n=1 Tax=Stenotrophomonas maltophilia TaxID=40324 RepID=UPI0028126BC6